MRRFSMVRCHALLFGCALGTVLPFAAVANAQQSPAQAAQPQLPTRDDLRPVPQQQQPERPRLSVIGDIERSPCPLADPKFAGVTVPVNNVTFNNLKGVGPEDMRAAWAQYAGTRQPVAILCEIRDAAATILRNHGYLAAVQVPTQRIENGEIRMEMLYARITAVRARGETTGAEAMIGRYLGKLTEDEIFDRNRAERYLLLARDLPGYNVQLTLKPAGTGPGELIGEVTVVRRPYALDFTVQNLSSKAVGRFGGQVRAQVFGLTGMGDATSLAFYSTSDFKEQQILQVGHEFRVGSEGLKISGQFTYAWTHPDIGTPGPSPIRARTAFGTVEAEYPLIRRQAYNLNLGGGLDVLDQHVDFNSTTISRDRVRVLFARVSGDAVDLKHMMPGWRISGTAELRKGVSIFNASDCNLVCAAAGGVGPSRPDGDVNAALLRAAGTAEIALGRIASIAFAPRVQIAFNPLVAFEEYSVGNYTVGRGFDPGSITGDSGIGASVELRGPAFSLTKSNILQIRPYLFTDGARTWNLRGTSAAEGLLSLGGGVRADVSDRLRLDAYMAVPTSTDTNGRIPKGVRFLFTLTTRLLPWSAR